MMKKYFERRRREDMDFLHSLPTHATYSVRQYDMNNHLIAVHPFDWEGLEEMYCAFFDRSREGSWPDIRRNRLFCAVNNRPSQPEDIPYASCNGHHKGQTVILAEVGTTTCKIKSVKTIPLSKKCA